MTAFASPAAVAATAAPQPSFIAPSGQPASAPLTRVALAYIEARFKLYLRFGEPARTHQLDRWRRSAVFLPGAVFCRIRWQANDYGTVRWQLMVMQACTPLDAAQRIPGVQPGARLLLHAEGDGQVRAVLERIDAIEARGIAPTDASPAYWRTLANRLAARLPLPDYTAERHRLAGREGAVMTAVSTGDTAPRPRSHARSRLGARIVLAGLAACGLAALAWASFVHPLPRLIYNPSDSVAVGWYRVDPLHHRPGSLPRPLSVDSIVLTTLPPDAAALAAQRGYLPARVPLLKRVGAVAPQHVCVFDALVWIDGVPVAAVRPADRLGRPLPSWPQCRQLRPGELFLLSSTNPASFDSRYFGPVSASTVIGVAHPIWLEARL